MFSSSCIKGKISYWTSFETVISLKNRHFGERGERKYSVFNPKNDRRLTHCIETRQLTAQIDNQNKFDWLPVTLLC